MPRKEQKKVSVVMSAIYALDSSEKAAKVRGIKGTCDTSDAFNASKPCQVAMSTWLDRVTDLEKKYGVRRTKEAELEAAREEEAKASAACDAAGAVFAATACDTAGTDPAVVKGMGLTLRAEATPADDLGPVTGVRVDTLKKNGEPRLVWKAAPGAVLYRAEMSGEPVGDGSWTALFGRGKSRKIPPLVRGQRSSFRVAAIGADGQMSGWSAVVVIVAE